VSEKLNLHQRIAAVMREVTYIQKEEKRGMQYKIVSHDKVTAKCRPALLAQGVIYYPIRCATLQSGNRTECNMTVRFANIDDPQDFIDVECCGHGIDTQDKGPGKAQSYAVKYALLKTLGLETGEDADHDSIEHRADAEIEKASRQTSLGKMPQQVLDAIEGAETMASLSVVWTANLRWQTDPAFAAAKDKRKLELNNEGTQQ
jgi:hypothetical protein